MKAVECDVGGDVPADADQQCDAHRIEQPHGSDGDGKHQKRIGKAQVAAHEPAVEREERGDEPDALVARAFLENEDLKVADAQKLPRGIDDDVGLIERQQPVGDRERRTR